jgi:hypothetical protein
MKLEFSKKKYNCNQNFVHSFRLYADGNLHLSVKFNHFFHYIHVHQIWIWWWHFLHSSLLCSPSYSSKYNFLAIWILGQIQLKGCVQETGKRQLYNFEKINFLWWCPGLNRVYFVTSYHVCVMTSRNAFNIHLLCTYRVLALTDSSVAGNPFWNAILYFLKFEKDNAKMQPWFLHQLIDGTPIFQIMPLPQSQQDWRLPDSCTHPFN